DALELGFALYAANPRLDVPGPLDRETALHAPESILPIVAADRPHRETEVLRLTLEAGWQQADTALRAALGLQQTRDDFRQLRANGTSASDSDDLHLLLEARHHIAAHEVRGGFAIAAGNRHLTRRANINGSDGPVFADLRLYANHLTFWCEDSIRLHDTLTLQGGLSASCYERRARPATGAPPATPSGSVDAALLAPRIQLTWTPTRALALFAGWSRAFEPPTFDDLLPRTGRPPNLGLAFNPLEAQRASTTEIGIRGGTETLRYEVTFYHAHWRDELLRLADATGTPLGTRNAGPTTHRGIESALRWRLLQAHQTLDLILTHTWSEATFDADPVFGDNHLAGLPRHAGSAELQFADRQGPFAALAAAWIGGTTWADHANRLGYDGHLIINARCGWRDPRGWTLYAEVTNLFDEAYIASTAGVLDIARNPAATTIFLPGSPRRWQVGLEWRW
ncbi:MAG: TonB-dependent receptor, partial [Verrucomicrobia bacterium]